MYFFWIQRSITKVIINYTNWGKRKTEVNLNTGGGKLSFFGRYAPEEGRVEENENVYSQLQRIKKY